MVVRTMRVAQALCSTAAVLALGTGCALMPPGEPAAAPGVSPAAAPAPSVPGTSSTAATHLPSAPATPPASASAVPGTSSPATRPATPASPKSPVPDLTIASVVNFRDAAGTGAGLPLAGGGHMVRGLVYRASALVTLSKADRTKLANIGVTDIYDLRTPGTASKYPDPAIGSAKYHLINLYATSKAKGATGSTAEKRLASRVRINREFVTDAAERARLAVMLKSFATAKGPVIVHCSEGKDRTGFVSAVLQLVAGVDQETIRTQYLMSNDARKDLIDADVAKVKASSGKAAADARRMDMTVYPQQIQASLDAIFENYGSVDKFLTKGVGLTQATVDKIRAKLQGP